MQALDTAFPGNPLDEVGLGQADGLPGRLDKAGLLQGLGSLWVSPILRARQTIAPIEAATGLSATVDSGLREVLAADLEMNTDARSVACYVDTTRAWMAPAASPAPRRTGTTRFSASTRPSTASASRPHGRDTQRPCSSPTAPRCVCGPP